MARAGGIDISIDGEHAPRTNLKTAKGAYITCTSPRSGSTLPCKPLASTGVAGTPQSYFHQPSIEAWANNLNLHLHPSLSKRDKLVAVFQAVISKGSPQTGIFGLRLQRGSFDYLTQQLAILPGPIIGDAAKFNAAFGRTSFLHLTRLDKVEQAISHVKADQTG